MAISRRYFLKSGGIAMLGMASLPSFLQRAVVGTPVPNQKKMVVLFQRGAMDGLNVVVPFGEPNYYRMRPTIAIPQPRQGGTDAALDLDGFFGLHPSLSPMLPLFRNGQLAIVQAVGSPDPTRSHFDAQDYMESGTPGRKATNDGWLNRALPKESGKLSPIRAISMGAALPRALRGSNDAVAINNLAEFQVKDAPSSMGFESMYGNSADKVLNGTGRETFEAVKLMQSIQKQPYNPANGAKYPNGRLGQSLMQIARLIKSDVGLEVAFTDVGGWDTHVNEVGAKPAQGQLANLLTDFGNSLGAFYQDLGDHIADVT